MIGDARQRWRCYVRMPAVTTPDRALAGARRWAHLFEGAGIPLAGEESGRGRVVPAAQLPLGIAGDREVVDLLLRERLSIGRIRELVAAALPPLMELVDLHDVWMGAPAAPAAVMAADYEAEVGGARGGDVGEAIAHLLRAASLPRERHRERKVQAYDLRPLLLMLRMDDWRDGPDGRGVGRLRMRLRHGPEGVGRPEEVLAVLSDALASAGRPGAPAGPAPDEPADPVVADGAGGSVPAAPPAGDVRLEAHWIRRTRLVMSDDPADVPDGPHAAAGGR